MSALDRNLSVIRALNDALNRSDEEAARALFVPACPGLTRVGLAAFASPRRLGGFKPSAVKVASKETLATGDDVIDRIVYAGTDSDNGKPFAVQHIHWWTLRDGLIVGHQGQRDDVAMLMQVGRLPLVPAVAELASFAGDHIAHRNVSGTPEQDRNLGIVLANRRAHNRSDVDAVVETFASNAQNHGRTRGREGMRRVLADILSTFSAVTDDDGIDAIAAIDDCVVVQYRRLMRHTGVGQLPINGGLLVGVPATNKTYTERHIHWWTLKDGAIVQHRACRDDVGMMLDLGLWPLAE